MFEEPPDSSSNGVSEPDQLLCSISLEEPISLDSENSSSQPSSDKVPNFLDSSIGTL